MKTFSLDEAQSLVPVLESLLGRAIKAKAAAQELEGALEGLNRGIFFSGGMQVDLARAGRQRAALDAAVREVKDAVEEIDAIGVQVKDIDTGLLDFPCQLGDEIVLLCWKMGEARIAHWHTIEAGFQGRRPLDERFMRNWPEKPN
jgi:hypothetical protein